MRQIATDRTPSAMKRSIAAWTDAGSSGTSTSPQVVQPLGDRLPPAARDERGGPLEIDVVQPGEPQPADLEHVAEPVGRQQPGRRAAALEDGVRGNRRPVQNLVDRVGADPGRLEKFERARDDRGRVVVCRRQDLAGQRVARRQDEDEVREGPADVDPEAVAHRPSLSMSARWRERSRTALPSIPLAREQVTRQRRASPPGCGRGEGPTPRP